MPGKSIPERVGVLEAEVVNLKEDVKEGREEVGALRTERRAGTQLVVVALIGAAATIAAAIFANGGIH